MFGMLTHRTSLTNRPPSLRLLNHSYRLHAWSTCRPDRVPIFCNSVLFAHARHASNDSAADRVKEARWTGTACSSVWPCPKVIYATASLCLRSAVDQRVWGIDAFRGCSQPTCLRSGIHDMSDKFSWPPALRTSLDCEVVHSGFCRSVHYIRNPG